jgi:hypothetical protein
MSTALLRDRLPQIHHWTGVKRLYSGIHFNSKPFERVEQYGMQEHKLHVRLPNLHRFWRFHVAPATNRRENTLLASTVGHVTSRMAERSYEIYANLCDALDELKIIYTEEPKPPRYRSCLNVLRYTGDTFQLFDELVDVIGTRTSRQRQHTGARDNLATILGTDIRLFWDWSTKWRDGRNQAIAYRNMLVHHGRPWLHFDTPQQEFVGYPYILRVEHCAYAGSKLDRREFLTWAEQTEKFKKPENRENLFIKLPDACAATCEATISWLNDAYGRIVCVLDDKLANPKTFEKYKVHCWGVVP